MEGVIPTMNGGFRAAATPEKASQSPYKKTTNFVTLSPDNKLMNISTPTKRPFRVSVEGNIGAGKSTFINHFREMPGIDTYAEPMKWWRDLDGHNLLELLYSDIQQWNSTFQMYVQLTRLQVQTTAPSSPSTTVQMFERSIQNNRRCFVEQAYQNGYLPGPEYTVIDHWYNYVTKSFDLTLDLIVYLRSTPEVVYQRMKSRNRPEEKEVSLKYLQQLHDSHEQWLMTDDPLMNTIPVLVLDADSTLEDIYEQYKANESKILGLDRANRVSEEDKETVKKSLDF